MSVSMAVDAAAPVEVLAATFAALADQDHERSILISGLLRRIKSYEGEFGQLKMELDDQIRSRKVYQQEALALREQNRKLEHHINKDGFAVCLIDGDGAKFLDGLIQDPRAGAAEAATRLKQAVRDDLAGTALADMDLPVLVRVYANLNHLAVALSRDRVIHSPGDMLAFAEAFTNSRWEFDYVNVGVGKENADSKMRKMLGHYMRNTQCRRIFFAGCHDNGYLHDLREHAGDDRIVLVETTTAEPGFSTLGLRMTRFDNVFRREPLSNENKKPPSQNRFPLAPRGSTDNVIAPHPSLPLPPSSKAGQPVPAAPEPVPTTAPPKPATSPPPGVPAPPAASRSASPAVVTLPLPPSANVTASGNGGISIRYPPSYAEAGADAGGYQNVTVGQAKKKKPRAIEYSEDGHRLDPPTKHPGQTPAQQTYQTKFDKIKPNVFCNDYYLAASCKRASKCDKDHGTKLTPDELAIHRYKARTSPCPAGPSCGNYGCYLSHHCIFDPYCARGQECKFSRTKFGDLHLTKEELVPATRWTEGESFPQDLRD